MTSHNCRTKADLKKLAMAGASGGSGSELGRLQTRVRSSFFGGSKTSLGYINEQ